MFNGRESRHAQQLSTISSQQEDYELVVADDDKKSIDSKTPG